MTTDEVKALALSIAAANHHPDPDTYAAEVVDAFNAATAPAPTPAPAPVAPV